MHSDEIGYGAGQLVRLNCEIPTIDLENPNTNEGEPEDPAAGIHDLAAVLLTLNSDLDKVIEQMQTIPAKQVTGTLRAKAKLAQQTETAGSDPAKDPARRHWAKKMRTDAKKQKAFDPRSLRGK